jgi:FMN phosphatase YigB (HAD superfamily)
MIKTVRAADLPLLLDTMPPGEASPPFYLSLDCFDTLLWRNCHAPRDVFADLDFAGGGMEPRMWAEARARRTRAEFEGLNEVSIETIYAGLMPAATAEARAAAIAAELAAEARHCFAFAPTVALIRAAKARGMQVIVVSDTYLSEPQLRALIAASAGADVAADIDRIFCSSEHGVSKGQGLFRHVLSALDCDPWSIFHVGDNLDADGFAPNALGVRTVHLKQFDAGTEQRLRLEAAAGTMMEPGMRVATPMLQPHRAQISLHAAQDATDVLGYEVIGPLMHVFAQWLRDEAALLAAEHGRPVKMLFLLRDGYLPQHVLEAIGGLETGGSVAAIEISRFSARRASFRDEAAVRDYLVSEPTSRIDVLANQLLLNPNEAAKLGRDHKAFRRAVLLPAVLGKIVSRSRAYADRLVQHVMRQGVTEGDTVMLVDLGYNGTVQNLITPLLVGRMKLRVAGRYLLMRESECSGLDKRGLFDPRHYDNKALHALCGPIAVLEQICTIAQGSCVDYSAEGKPIRKVAGIKSAQSDLRDRIQDAVLDFAIHAGTGVHRAPASDDADARRRMAMAIFARLLFLPQAEEVAILRAFDHDVNLGTTDLEKLIDIAQSEDGLRRHGLSYVNGVTRMYLPGELQPHGLPLNFSLFGVSRFGLDFRSADFQTGSLSVPVIMAEGSNNVVIDVAASPTHDGYHMMTVPIGAGRYTLGIQLGAIADWVQIEDAAFYRVADFAEGEGKTRRAIAASPVADAMDDHGDGLFRCTENGLLFVPPPIVQDDEPLLLALVFRPIVRRRAVALRQAA